MKKFGKVVIAVALATGLSSTSWADDPSQVETAQQTTQMNDKLGKLLEYFTHYGSYLGMDVKTAPGNTATFDINDLTGIGRFLVFNSIYMNPLLGTVFNNFSNPSGQSIAGGPTISVNPTVDQPFPNTSNYASTPTGQNLLNNLNSAMDEFNCYDPNCLTSLAIELNVIGNDFLTQSPATARPFGNLNQTTLDQMNLDTLIAPMTYTTNPPNQGLGSPFGGGNSQQQPGLSSANQAQQANNFIRYLSGGTLPITLPAITRFRTYLTTWQDTTKDQTSRQDARASMLRIIGGLRLSAAQLSVGVSNLYAIFTRRMPNQATANKSELQVEYEMATRRLFNPAQGATEWHKEMEKADTLTQLRQINYLLAEINYQLFLNRQMMERNVAATSTIVLEQQQFMRTMISGDSDISGTDFNIPVPKYTF